MKILNCNAAVISVAELESKFTIMPDELLVSLEADEVWQDDFKFQIEFRGIFNVNGVKYALYYNGQLGHSEGLFELVEMALDVNTPSHPKLKPLSWLFNI